MAAKADWPVLYQTSYTNKCSIMKADTDGLNAKRMTTLWKTNRSAFAVL